MATQIYSGAAVYLNHGLLAENTDVSINFNGNHQRVNTLARGFAGLSKGASVTEISFTSAVPDDGFEVDPVPFVNNMEVVEVTIFAASSTLTLKGFVEQASLSKGVDNAMQLTFSFVGGPAVWD